MRGIASGNTVDAYLAGFGRDITPGGIDKIEPVGRWLQKIGERVFGTANSARQSLGGIRLHHPDAVVLVVSGRIELSNRRSSLRRSGNKKGDIPHYRLTSVGLFIKTAWKINILSHTGLLYETVPFMGSVDNIADNAGLPRDRSPPLPTTA